jgi:hypothetical protein
MVNGLLEKWFKHCACPNAAKGYGHAPVTQKNLKTTWTRQA